MQNGSVVILCGTSSTLVDLALNRNMTSFGETLAMNYYNYPGLNHQKFKPLVLPLVELEDVSVRVRFMLSFCGCIQNKNPIAICLRRVPLSVRKEIFLPNS
jgi:hypothetical protein